MLVLIRTVASIIEASVSSVKLPLYLCVLKAANDKKRLKQLYVKITRSSLISIFKLAVCSHLNMQLTIVVPIVSR
jgi:hypothetical protein